MDNALQEFEEQQLRNQQINELLKIVEFMEPQLKQKKLCNHLPFIIICLFLMDGTQEEIQEFTNFYILNYQLKSIQVKENLNEIRDENFMQCVSNYNNLWQFKRLFSQFDQEFTRLYSFKYVFKQLIQGSCIQLFHPITRISYALQSQCQTEIYNALSYLCVAYKDLSFKIELSEAEKSQTYDVNKQFQILRDFYKPLNIEFQGTMEERIYKILFDKEFQYLIRDQKEKGGRDMAFSIISLYLYNPNYILMHLIIGMQAMRNLLNIMGENKCSEIGWNRFWEIACAAYVCLGTPDFEIIPPSNIYNPDDIKEWPEIFQQTRKSKDEHSILFVYACYKEQHYFYGKKGYQMYQIAAQKEVFINQETQDNFFQINQLF